MRCLNHDCANKIALECLRRDPPWGRVDPAKSALRLALVSKKFAKAPAFGWVRCLWTEARKLLLFCRADFVVTLVHKQTRWRMGYFLEPTRSLRARLRVLGEDVLAVQVVLEHTDLRMSQENLYDVLFQFVLYHPRLRVPALASEHTSLFVDCTAYEKRSLLSDKADPVLAVAAHTLAGEEMRMAYLGNPVLKVESLRAAGAQTI